jgi:hypothetical protein
MSEKSAINLPQDIRNNPVGSFAISMYKEEEKVFHIEMLFPGKERGWGVDPNLLIVPL